MDRQLSKTHIFLLVLNFFFIITCFVLCINYFFVTDIGIANIISNCSLIVAFLTTIWYMLIGYKIDADYAFCIPMFAYALSVIIMIAANTVAISKATPFITGSTSTIIAYSMIIAFNQNRPKLCLILFGICLLSELGQGFFTLFMHSAAGIINNGTISATMNNVHLFVRSFLTSTLALCYVARYLRLKKEA